MATDEVTTPAQKVTKVQRIRQIGERFTDPERGEILVVERSGCDGCVYISGRNDYSRSACNAPERLELTGSCVPPGRHDGTSVQFVNLNDYAVFKLTGEWPRTKAAPSARSSNTQDTTKSWSWPRRSVATSVLAALVGARTKSPGRVPQIAATTKSQFSSSP